MSNWISVKDRLPEEEDLYLCCLNSFRFPGKKYIKVLRYDNMGFVEGRIYTDSVTHWMKLPEPPKED